MVIHDYDILDLFLVFLRYVYHTHVNSNANIEVLFVYMHDLKCEG